MVPLRELCSNSPSCLYWKEYQETEMPKLKTHKGASKRFKKTATGKVARRHAFARHILTSKTRSRKRRLGKTVLADETNQASLQRMIPY